MKLVSNRDGEYPFGTHWSPGEVREVSEATAENAPKWLSVVAQKPAKKKKAKDPAPATAPTEG